jgi:hypothetical protein
MQWDRAEARQALMAHSNLLKTALLALAADYL